ncbi:MAG: hypothetical protein EXQ58_10525 [Acidobacteria bacterium]|nr:hypothetical protein [Acidobacteriota bacterium]
MISGTISHYRILSPLGAGGMGEVFRARDTRLTDMVGCSARDPSAPRRWAWPRFIDLLFGKDRS